MAKADTDRYIGMAINTAGHAHASAHNPEQAVQLLADAVLQLGRALEDLSSRVK